MNIFSVLNENNREASRRVLLHDISNQNMERNEGRRRVFEGRPKGGISEVVKGERVFGDGGRSVQGNYTKVSINFGGNQGGSVKTGVGPQNFVGKELGGEGDSRMVVDEDGFVEGGGGSDDDLEEGELR